MKNYRMTAIILALIMMLSLAACGSAQASAQGQETAPAGTEAQSAPAEPVAPEVPAELSDTDAQLELICDNMDKMLQPAGELPWFYTVTDLDRDGCLELIAASQHPQDRSTNLKIWEVSSDRDALTECSVEKDEEESFPDIMSDSMDTFHTADDTWNYLFYDNVVISDTEVYTSKSAFSMKDDVISYEAFAVEHTLVENGVRTTTHTDIEGVEITPEQYNASGVQAFEGAERSSVSFEWLTPDEATDITRLTESFMVFTGLKKATEHFPVPKPAALDAPEATASPAPAATPAPTATPAPVATPVPTEAPAPQPIYLDITKNPTSEPGKTTGGTALFIASANVFDYVSWMMVSPEGLEYTPAQFSAMFPQVSISGYYGTTLSLGNLTADVSGWGAYCTFYYKGQTARTTTAYVYVSAPRPEPKSGVSYGSVLETKYAYVSIWLNEGYSVIAEWRVVDLDGDIYIGAPATVYWDGTPNNVTYCVITGSRPQPQPVYGSMSGYAHEGGGGYAIDLVNGTQVFVDAWNCKVEGKFYDGCDAIVYYIDYPSNSNVYKAEIYGNMGLLIPEEDQGGWAGSHYYDSMDGYEEDQGGWAGSHYYDFMESETGNYVDGMPTHFGYNSDGSHYEAIWCPDCGAEVSLAMERCPACGRSFI